MSQAFPLISGQVQIMDDRLALIHIPLDLYPLYLHPILQLIFHEVPVMEDDEDDAEDPGTLGVNSDPSHTAFLNLSITPVECSIVCTRELAEKYFAPVLEKVDITSPENGEHISISEEDYIAMQIDGDGLDAGQRVLELSSPLAMAGISILFISTYFSDYILVPLHSKEEVTSALQSRGFTVEASGDRFVSNGLPEYHYSAPPSPIDQFSSLEGIHHPPPSTLPDLESRTFENLRKRNIHPTVDKSLRLVQCAAHHRYPTKCTSYSILRPGLTTTLVLDKPRFLSLTVTPTDPSASILLEQRLLPRFFLDTTSTCGNASTSTRAGDDECNLLLGSKDDILVPIILDLRDLPLEASGIICGVASKLAAATRSRRTSEDHGGFGSGPPADPDAGKAFPLDSPPEPLVHVPAPVQTEPVEISFLSTVRAGTVIVDERELGRAIAALDAESGSSSHTTE